jgi:hypothetical protein
MDDSLLDESAVGIEDQIINERPKKILSSSKNHTNQIGS